MRRLQAFGKSPAWPGEPLERAMEEQPEIRGRHLASRLIGEVRHVGVTAESWAPREGEQDV
jgi:hypothetical protein